MEKKGAVQNVVCLTLYWSLDTPEMDMRIHIMTTLFCKTAADF